MVGKFNTLRASCTSTNNKPNAFFSDTALVPFDTDTAMKEAYNLTLNKL